ncbi:MAG: hypothetical protein K0Q72_746 [Armatimonadetes bacterium]|jgi:chromosome segregation ATPase|nr:hypothetical protein [Armatimonadota bacterium]
MALEGETIAGRATEVEPVLQQVDASLAAPTAETGGSALSEQSPAASTDGGTVAELAPGDAPEPPDSLAQVRQAFQRAEQRLGGVTALIQEAHEAVVGAAVVVHELEAARAEARRWREQCEAGAEANRGLVGRVASLEQELLQERAQVQELQGVLGETNEQLTTLHTANEHLSGELREARLTLRETEARLSRVNQQVDRLANWRTSYEALEKRADGLAAQLQTLQLPESKQLQEQLAALGRERDTAVEAAAAREQEAAALREQLAAATSETAAFRARLDVGQRRLTEALAQGELLRERLRRAEQSGGKAGGRSPDRSELVRVQAAADAAERELAHHRVQVSELQDQLAAAVDKATALQQELGQRNVEQRLLAAEVEQGRADVESCRSQLERWGRRSRELQQVADLSRKTRLAIVDLKSRYAEVVTDKAAVLLNHSLMLLSWAVAMDDRPLRSAMLVNLHTVARCFKHSPNFPAVLTTVERIEPQVASLPDELSPSKSRGDGHHYFQYTLDALRVRHKLALSSFRYDVDADGNVHEVS